MRGAPLSRSVRPGVPGTPHYRDLDGIRGILAVAVMLLHYGVNGFISKLTGGLEKVRSGLTSFQDLAADADRPADDVVGRVV